MSINRISGAGNSSLQTPTLDAGSAVPGGGRSAQAHGPQGLTARPVLTRSQSLPPRMGLPGKPLPKVLSRSSSMPHAMHESAEPDPVLPSAEDRTQTGKTQGESSGKSASGVFASSAAAGGGKPPKVDVEVSVDIEPACPGAGGGVPSGSTPSTTLPMISDMQQLQQMQRQNLEQQALFQRLNIEMQTATARMKVEMDLNSAFVGMMKAGSEAIKHAAPS